MWVDPLHVGIALGPLAVYFVVLGLVNLFRRPLVTTGARDAAALGLCVAGLVIVGPMDLFLPEAADVRFGWKVWPLLLSLYGLCLTLVVLLMRPKLIIYNVTTDQLRPILAAVVAELDSDARWAGDSLVLPKIGVQLHVEPVGALRTAELVAAGPEQSYLGWRRLEAALAAGLKQSKGTRNPYGPLPLILGLLMIALVTALTVSNPQAVAQSLRQLLRL